MDSPVKEKWLLQLRKIDNFLKFARMRLTDTDEALYTEQVIRAGSGFNDVTDSFYQWVV